MRELVAQLAARGDALGPRRRPGSADAAPVGVLLVAAKRRIRRHRPPVGKIGMPRVRARRYPRCARSSQPWVPA